jgi:transcriptional regulator with XRE-family HTH domain
LTLDTVAGRTGLTAAMVSMVELGRVAPSFGTLIAIASALNIHMSDLFYVPESAVQEPVRRMADQLTFESSTGVLRRLLQIDDSRGLEFVINEYGPQTSSAMSAVHHAGYEYGLLLEGSLVVELDGEAHELKSGDSIAYSSSTPHRISNNGSKTARAVWVKLDSDRALQGRTPRTDAAVAG